MIKNLIIDLAISSLTLKIDLVLTLFNQHTVLDVELTLVLYCSVIQLFSVAECGNPWTE